MKTLLRSAAIVLVSQAAIAGQATAQSWPFSTTSTMSEAEFVDLMVGNFVGVSGGVTIAQFNYSMCCAGPGGVWAGPSATLTFGRNWSRPGMLFGAEVGLTGQIVRADGVSGLGDFTEYTAAEFRLRHGPVNGPRFSYITAGLGLTEVATQTPGSARDARFVTGIVTGIGVESAGIAQGVGLGADWTGRVEVLYATVPRTRLTSGVPVEGGSNNLSIRLGFMRHM